jgi:hypothetical protein
MSSSPWRSVPILLRTAAWMPISASARLDCADEPPGQNTCVTMRPQQGMEGKRQDR